MRNKLCFVILLLGLSGVANAQELILYSGEELYERFCSSCHGISAQGDGPVASSLAYPVPDLTSLTERHDDEFPAAWVREAIDGRFQVMAHGPRAMPVWGYEFWIEEGADVLAEEETRTLIERLVTYIRSLQRAPQNEAPR